MSNKPWKFLLVLLPVIVIYFWLASLQIGGDDSKLYYYFPSEYLTHFSTKIISDNQAGSLGFYFSQTYTTAITTSLTLAKYLIKQGSFLQGLSFALNILASLYFFWKLFRQLSKSKSNLVCFISSVLYTTSSFTYFSVWTHQLFSVYLLSLFPAAFYFLLKFLETKKYKHIFSLLLISFLLSFTFFSIPWILATLIVFSPLILNQWHQNKKYLIKFSLIFFPLIILLNAHWLFHFIYAPLTYKSGNGDVISQVTSGKVADNSAYNIAAISRNNSLFYPINQVFHKSIQEDFGWKTLDVFKNYYEKFIPFNFIFIFVIGLSFLLEDDLKKKRILLVSLASWLMALYFFTVNIGSWGLSLFLKMNKYLPGFSMFRNMQDKFSIGLALSSAILIGLSLSTLTQKIKNQTVLKLTMLFILLVTAINAYPFIKGELIKLPFGTSLEIYNRLKNTEEQVGTVINGFDNLDSNKKILWFPLNTANYVIIKDKYVDKQVYAGVSPLSLLTNYSDFNGLLSFNEYQKLLILDYINNKKYQDLGNLFKTLNIGYIALYDFNSENIEQSYLFSMAEPGDFYKKQKETQLLKTILGEKIKSVDNYYTIYKINDSFSNQKIYTTDSYENIPAFDSTVNFTKIDSHKYKIKINNLTEKRKLVFLDPYHDKWQLYLGDQTKNPIIYGKHFLVFNYANGWDLDPEIVGNNPELTLYFQPYDYYFPMIVVSITTLAIVICSYIYFLRREEDNG